MPDKKTKAQAKARAKKLKAEAKKKGKDATPALSGASISAAFAGSKPVAERLLYDDDLRDNIRTFLESAQKIMEEISDEKPDKIISRLWDDDKLRDQVESAVGAAQKGAKRVRGVDPDKGGKFGKILLLFGALVAFLMLNPKTGPEARRISRDVYRSVSSNQ